MLRLPLTAWAGLALLSTVRTTAALTQQYCSSENTGSDFQVVFETYNSNGACYTTCQDGYAFAIVQYQNCWCSNYAPGETVSSDECDETCPGYPDETCGSESKNLYGYVALPNPVWGTAGASSSASSAYTSQPSTQTQEPSPTSTDQFTSDPPSTVSQTVYSTITPTPYTDTQYVVSTYVPTFTTSPTSAIAATTATDTPAATSSHHTSTPSSTASPVTSVEIISISGAVVTQTVTTTPDPAPDTSGEGSSLPHRKDLSGGAIAGIVIGVVVAIAAVAIGLFLLWRRKREYDEAGSTGPTSPGGPKKSPTRTTSVLSKTGLLGTARRTEKDWDEPLYINTGQNSVRHSQLYGAGALGAGVSPVSPLDSHDSTHSRRQSRPLVYDQRLNPSALYASQDPNGSRISMQDTQDYSRTLGVVNPDPRPSFESRTTVQ